METGIPDPKASFAQNMRNIAKSLENGQYEECFRKNVELTQFSHVLQHADWIFLCEVLESVYLNMAELLKAYNIHDDAETDIRGKLCANLKDVLQAFEGNDDTGKYRALRKMRADATAFQLSAAATYPERRGFLG